MTKLLISVRDATEARIALAAGVDLIDVKEPARGSLGAADDSAIAEVMAVVDRQRPVSAALGELLEFSPRDTSGSFSAEVLGKLSYAKIGLAGCANASDWLPRWARWCETLPVDVGRVAVAYADWEKANSPPIDEILRHGAALGCRALLIDTFDKTGPSLPHLLPLEEIEVLRKLTANAGVQLVLAGRLELADIPTLLPLRANYLAFRGAACSASRTGRLCSERVGKLLATMHLQCPR